jgi:putative DNA primase/helicase
MRPSTDRDKLLLAGHRKRGGCIRLFPDEAVTYGLAIAEGIESALSAAHAYTPVWATIDAGNLAAFPVLAGIESLVIFHDADDRGIEAAAECAARWSAAHKEVLLVSPSRAQTDINDEVNA